jgi:hypothetical protein
MSIEEKYQDVLQNIEFGIVSVYRQNAALLDYDVFDALEALTRHYAAEEANRQPPALRLAERAQVVFDAVKDICEWRLGRQKLIQSKGGQPDLIAAPLAVSEIIACLKRIQTSARRWNKQGGRQGYLKFVSEFL